MLCVSDGLTPHSLLMQNRTMSKTDFLDHELSPDDLKTINGGWSGWVIRAWRQWIGGEADEGVTALGDLNDYAKKTTGNDSLEED